MSFLPEMLKSLHLDIDPETAAKQIVNQQHYPSFFDVSGLAASSFLALGEALRSLLSCQYPAMTPTLEIDQRLASLWFDRSLHLIDGSRPTGWDQIAGDYRCANGWIRLHTNAPHHKAAALKVLQVPENRDMVANAVSTCEGQALETAIVTAGGCAAQMRSLEDWAVHPQGHAVRQEPLLDWSIGPEKARGRFSIGDPQRPLNGLKVLDITRVIAGPVATRALAGFGANVLRIDPEHWHEPALFEELTIGKRCAHLNLQDKSDKQIFLALVAEADVLIHGLRGDALSKLDLSIDRLRTVNPALIDVAHNAYGWTGPWANRRGFDSLVQMSAGIAAFGMKAADAQKPLPLPVQALDHATGYLVAAAAIMAIKSATEQNRAVSVRTSLARVGWLLSQTAKLEMRGQVAPATPSDFCAEIEQTNIGDALRLEPAIRIEAIPQYWSMPARPLRSASPVWRDIN
ncbi:CoA transferase [Maritalea porphyrae]|jgi:hypothetical protein|uniref:CoA transferase n=1 Tax=Maritalea porphyrae TaxID=880732 RepID=UPI0022B01D5F|nr:CoA transferase [Maritalea porphyrae]MCZ4272058.1 CoA transferase [Maritalea porphyrae]